jgi:metallophosphoesterase (TIGR03767 family)
MTRRDLLRAGAAISGAMATGLHAGGVAAQELTHTTLDRVLRKGAPGEGGYSGLVARRGEPHIVRAELGVAAKSSRRLRRRGLIAFAQITDAHVVDAQSPLRVEWVDRFDDQYSGSEPTTGLFGSAYRPHEMLSAHISEAMVRAINKITRAPVTKRPLAFTLQTGDNSDNCQFNEIRWNIDVLDGGVIRPDSGDPTRYEGVADGDPSTYDTHYYHPDGTPDGATDDIARTRYGFPAVTGLLAAARRPFVAHGLAMPWYTAFGNHDVLMQGNFPPSTMQLNDVATGSLKLVSPPTGLSQSDLMAAFTGDYGAFLQALTATPHVRQVTADPDRRVIDRAAMVEEHFNTVGAPIGHGFTEQNRTDGTAYYAFDKAGIRFIVLDTVNPNGYADGSLDQTQYDWLVRLLASTPDRLIVVGSHHTSSTMTNPLVGTGLDPEQRVLGDVVLSLLLAHKNVIAWVNGHSHRNQIWARSRADGSGLWEINTASHIDWPQQSRIIEIVDNRDGTLSIFTTIVDHAGSLHPSSTDGVLQLAGWGRELAANDWHERTSTRLGKPTDRNVELVLRHPLR